MTEQVTWHKAQPRHRTGLTEFTCTPPAPPPSAATRWRDTFPLWWEREVQKRIRDLRPPYDVPEHMLVGVDDEGIAAVSYFVEAGGADVVHLTYVAVALRWRHQGSEVARELVSQTFDHVTSRAIQAGVPFVRLSAYVHPENQASRKLCTSSQLRHNGYTPTGMEVWTNDLAVDEHDPWLWDEPI